MDEKWVKSKRVSIKQLSEIKPSVMFDPEVDAEYNIGLQSMFEEQEIKVKTLQGIQGVLRRLLHSNSKSVYIQTDQAIWNETQVYKYESDSD